MVLGWVAMPARTVAQTDEIQVYDAAIAEPGIFNLMIHTNFTPIGRRTPDTEWRGEASVVSMVGVSL